MKVGIGNSFLSLSLKTFQVYLAPLVVRGGRFRTVIIVGILGHVAKALLLLIFYIGSR